MNKTKLAAISLCLSALSVCMPLSAYAQTNVNEYGTSWRWNGGTIEVESPERGEGQKSVLGLALAPMESVRVGFVGLGMRGPGAVERFTYIPGVEIKALCDYDPARAEGCQKYLTRILPAHATAIAQAREPRGRPPYSISATAR